jgi:hypothetical protein
MYHMSAAFKSTLKSGHQMVQAKRMILIGKMYDLLTSGYMTTYALSRELGVSRKAIDLYRPLVDDLISKSKLDRTVIRNLELQRAYRVIEKLMEDLNEIEEAYKPLVGGDALNAASYIDRKIKAKTLIYNQIAKHSSRTALITGLNIETQVNVDQHQLVIIRADNNKKPVIEVNDA